MYFEFHCPTKIISGRKAVSKVPFELEQLGVGRPLIVTDKGVRAAGLLAVVEAALTDYDMLDYVVYDETPVDSGMAQVDHLAELFKTHDRDCFIAVGGGSVIDTAKGANIAVSQPEGSILKLLGNYRITAALRPLVVIPTTAGTGSEVTNMAIIAAPEQQKKHSFVSDKLTPTLAIIDPAMTLTCPPKLTAATGMDALTHAVEAYLSTMHNPVSDALAFSAVRMIRTNLVRVAEVPGDAEARLAMATAANLAGMAFSNSLVGAVHALSHAVGGLCHVPHGVANGILLPWTLEFLLPAVEARISDLAEPLGVAPGGATALRAAAAINEIRELQRSLNRLTGLPTRLSEAGVGREELQEIAEASVFEGGNICSPRELTTETALEVLTAAF